MVGGEKREQLWRSGEGLAVAGADVLDDSAELVRGGLACAGAWCRELDHERLHRRGELDTGRLNSGYEGAKSRLTGDSHRPLLASAPEG